MDRSMAHIVFFFSCRKKQQTFSNKETKDGYIIYGLIMDRSGTSISKYVKDFESLFVPINEIEIINKARNGTLGQSQFRSICWRYFLGCLSKNSKNWLDVTSITRKEYEVLKAKNLAHQRATSSKQSVSTGEATIRPLEIPSINQEFEQEQRYIRALNQSDQSNVSKTIERDVVRTFPDMEFFRQTEIQSTLVNVLFNYACENHHLSYKQGMHELVATLLYVLHTDTSNCLINHQGGYANETIAGLMDFKYIEHDLYTIFNKLMNHVGTWYQNDEIITGQQAHIKTIHHRPIKKQVHSVLGVKLKKISESIVRRHDPELFNHLQALQIAPQIYGIRWMRLLFGREFDFLNLLRVWDSDICDQNSMSLTDYIFASMLITNREELVNGDYTDCLNNLMRHQYKDVNHVITLALYLRDPVKNTKPTITQDKDLHSIVDYCWRLLSEQIDSLQKCLPREKSLNSEDEIFIALAQLKKVRDVLKGSLKLEDELDLSRIGYNS